MRLYRALLLLYPAGFRAEYGKEMCAIFARRQRAAAGILATILLWLEAFFSTLVNALQVHWDVLGNDLRFTIRTLRRSPGFTFTAILVSALGIGATTAAFSITDHVLLRPLPYAESDRLVKLWEDQTPKGYSQEEPSPANYRDWKRMSKSFEAMGAYSGLSLNMSANADPERLDGAVVTFDLFPMLGVQPALGRSFTATDDRGGSPGTILISDGLWKRRFGGEPGVLGRQVILDDAPYTIVGVMPPNFSFPSRKAELWKPFRFEENDYEERDNNYLKVVARLRRHVSLQQSRAEMSVITAQLQRQYPKASKVRATITRLRDEVSQQTRLLLFALFGAAFCVLLIACTNLANLLLARAMTRRKELAVRTALGAGRERLVRQLLTESLLLALCGGLLGVLIAYISLPLLSKLVPNALPIVDIPSIDVRILGFAALVATLTGIAFGVAPALRAFRETDGVGLREESRSGVGGRKERVRSVLVVAQVAGSLVLLISSGLLIRALWRLQSVDPGFRAADVLTMETSLPMPKYSKTSTRVQFYSRVLSDVRALPGVSQAAYISFLPIAHGGGIWPVSIEGQPPDDGKFRLASLRFVTPGFFATLGIPIRQGRDVSESDTAESPYVALLSQSFVDRYWPGQNPLGRRFKFGLSSRTVAGVVGNIRVRGLETSSEPQVYLPYKQVADGNIMWYSPKDLVIRYSVASGDITPAVRAIVRRADPEQPISNVEMLEGIVHDNTAPRRAQVRVLGGFAAIAFLLAGIGIHGLLSFTVANRRQEIGVRIALGAQASDILSMVLGEGVLLAALGVVLGAALAYALGRAMQALLAGVAPGDLPTFATATALALLMTFWGSLLPALRAMHVDPTTAIRAE